MGSSGMTRLYAFMVEQWLRSGRSTGALRASVLVGVTKLLVFKPVSFRLLGLDTGVCVRIWVDGKM